MKAFPTNVATNQVIIDEGMDLRDYFAAKAMQGILSRSDAGIEYVVRSAYEIADRMMRARKSEQTT